MKKKHHIFTGHSGRHSGIHVVQRFSGSESRSAHDAGFRREDRQHTRLGLHQRGRQLPARCGTLLGHAATTASQEYNQFYHDFSILREENEALKVFRLALSANVGKIVKTAMGLLGIEVPERM